MTPLAPQLDAGLRSVKRRLRGANYLRKWVVLGALIGVVGGIGAIAFYTALELATHFFLGFLGGYTPPSPAGEGGAPITGFARAWALPLVVALGGLISGIIVYRFAPEAEGHGTDAAIAAYHHNPRRVMDLIRRTLVTPKAVRDMVHLLNEDIQMRAERRAPDLDEAKALIRKLQHEDANLRRALRSAGPRASERINVEIEAVAAELAAAQARIAELDQAERPLRITTKLVRQTIDDMNGILDHALLATRVAWVRDLFERIDVDSRDEKAVAVWRAATDEGVNRSDSVYEWLRR